MVLREGRSLVRYQKKLQYSQNVIHIPHSRPFINSKWSLCLNWPRDDNTILIPYVESTTFPFPPTYTARSKSFILALNGCAAPHVPA